MKYNFYFLIISILFSSVINFIYEPILYPFEVNDGEVRNIRNLVEVIWIYTKISRDSKIIMEITSQDEAIIKKEDVKYGKYYKETNKTEMVPISLFVVNGNNYKLTYDVPKDNNGYGIVEIDNLALGQTLTIKVDIISKPMWWLIITGIIIVSIALLIGLFILCRTFLRCCR